MNDNSGKKFGVTWMACLALALLLGSAAKAGAGAAGPQSVALAWNASADLNVTNYNLFYGVASGVYTNEIAVGNNLTATVTGLVPGITYYFVTTAEDSNGNNSAYSNETNWVASPLSCSVTLTNLMQFYNGQSIPVAVSTNPTNVPVNVTYNGSPSAPTNAGSYTVLATAASPIYRGAATNMLTILPIWALINLANLVQNYDGAGVAVSVNTQPAALPVTVTYNGLSSLPSSPGSYVVVASIVGGNYVGSTSNTLLINKAPQTISLQPLAADVISLDQFTKLMPLVAAASSGLPVTLRLGRNSPALLTATNTLASLGMTGNVMILANQSGNSNYAAAPQAVLNLEVTNGNQAITFDPMADQIVTNAPFQLTASASSGLAVQFTVLSGPATVGGNVLTLTGTGVVTVEAAQPGNTNWNPAAPMDQTFTVNPAPVSAAAPVITAQPANQAVAGGGEATFSVAAGSILPLRYQWNFDGTKINGATNASLKLTDVQFDQAGNYAVSVSNSLGSILSSNAALAVGLPPGIQTQPASQSVESNCDATFNVLASGAGPLRYQWWNNGVVLDSATNSNLAITGVQASNFGGYSVVVTNVFGATTSAVAVLALASPPMANPATVLRYAEGGVRLSVSDLTANGTVAMYDVLTLVAVSSNSAAGGSVSLNGPWIYYTPPESGAASDTFTYTVSDGHCGRAVGTVTVQLNTNSPQPLHFGIAKMGDGSLQLAFDGLPGGTYQIQFTESLSSPNWKPLTNQTADGFGVLQFTDWPATNAVGRFYRAVWPVQ